MKNPYIEKWQKKALIVRVSGIDRIEIIVLNCRVKIAGALILIAFIVAASPPLKPSVMESPRRDNSSFFTFHICSKAGSPLLSAFDVFTHCEKSYEPLKPVFTSPHTITNQILYLYQSVSLMDHPPDA